MAQTKPMKWYGGNAPGVPGMRSNATVETVRSFAAEGGVEAGVPVVRGKAPDKQVKAAAASGGTAPDKQVKAAAASDVPVGVTVWDPAGDEEGDAYYPDGYAVPVMTEGDIWVTAGGNVAAGDAVAYNTSAGGFTKGTESTASGNMFLTAGAKGDIVEIHIQNPALIVVS